LGATHTLDTTDLEDMTSAMRELTEHNLGPTLVIKTTGAMPVIYAAYNSLANGGTMVFVGGTKNLLQEFTFGSLICWAGV
jgi:Zn-dependent alcohol dehydrogenase